MLTLHRRHTIMIQIDNWTGSTNELTGGCHKSDHSNEYWPWRSCLSDRVAGCFKCRSRTLHLLLRVEITRAGLARSTGAHAFMRRRCSTIRQEWVSALTPAVWQRRGCFELLFLALNAVLGFSLLCVEEVKRKAYGFHSQCEVDALCLFPSFPAGCTITFRRLADCHQDATIQCLRWRTSSETAKLFLVLLKLLGGLKVFYTIRFWLCITEDCVCFRFSFRMESSPCGRTGAINVEAGGSSHSPNSRDTLSLTAFGWRRFANTCTHSHAFPYKFFCTLMYLNINSWL